MKILVVEVPQQLSDKQRETMQDCIKKTLSRSAMNKAIILECGATAKVLEVD